MRVLVKIGGALIDDAASRRRLAAEIGQLQRQGDHVVVVHGGGKQMTRFLAERGVESHFVNGLRVTSPPILDAVVKVVAGTVNQNLVSAFVAEGVRAVGLTGADDCLAEATTLDPELGSVGKIVGADAELLELLAQHGFLPVVACVAADRRENVYNVNADQMAVACAIAFRADYLFFLTDVEGVMNSDGQVLRQLPAAEARRLIDTRVATGGMQAKLTAALDALSHGVGQVAIGPGARPGILASLHLEAGAGTRILPK